MPDSWNRHLLIAEIRSRRKRLASQEIKSKAAQVALWQAVADAHQAGLGLDDIISAAGWKTKKSVYDAIERVSS